MGYFTNYSIYLENGPEEEYAKMLKNIDDILGCGDMSAFEAVYANGTAWRRTWRDCRGNTRTSP